MTASGTVRFYGVNVGYPGDRWAEIFNSQAPQYGRWTDSGNSHGSRGWRGREILDPITEMVCFDFPEVPAKYGAAVLLSPITHRRESDYYGRTYAAQETSYDVGLQQFIGGIVFPARSD